MIIWGSHERQTANSDEILSDQFPPAYYLKADSDQLQVTNKNYLHNSSSR